MNFSVKAFIHRARQIGLTDIEKAEGLFFLETYVRTAPSSRHNGVNEQQFLETARGIRLSSVEKAHAREFLLQATLNSSRPLFSWVAGHLFSRASQVIVGTLVIALASSSAVFASESSLPGEVLYPLKIHVAERLRVSFASGIEAETRLELELAERRLEEAEMLTLQFGMNPEREEQIAKRFRAHAVAMHEKLRSLLPGDPKKANSLAIDFEASLRAHSKVLERLSPMDTLQKDVSEARMNSEEAAIETSNFAVYRQGVDRRAIRLIKEDKVFRGIKLPQKKREKPKMFPKDELISDPSTGAAALSQTDDDKDDTVFGAKVRLRMTERELAKIRSRMKEGNAKTPSTMEARVGGVTELMHIATMELDAGNTKEALKASDAALKYSESAKKEMEAGEEVKREVKLEKAIEVK